MAMLVTIFTDASFCHRTRAAGWAAWIKCDGKTVRLARAFTTAIKSSNDAEIGAAANAICYTIAALQLGIADRIILQSDCLGVKSALEKINQKNYEPHGFTRRCVEAIRISFKKHGEPRIEIRHVKSHRGTEDKRAAVNTFVDQQSRKQMRLVRAQLDSHKHRKSKDDE